MSLYVELQEEVIEWLRHLKKNHPKRLANVIRTCKTIGLAAGHWVGYLQEYGLAISFNEWMRDVDFPELVLEQIDESGSEVVIKGILGSPLYDYGCEYGLEGWVEYRGTGMNCLRTPYCAQPGVLHAGDVLATGERVLGPPREGGNGEVLVHISDGRGGTWFSFPSRTALALLPPDEKVPIGLIVD